MILLHKEKLMTMKTGMIGVYTTDLVGRNYKKVTQESNL
jgi:hypothetical protein